MKNGHMDIGGIKPPAVGSIPATGATRKDCIGSAGEKGRAVDPNCDKYHSGSKNP